jgi:hypothetical protein
MSNPAYVRNFESLLRALVARGHAVTVLFEGRKAGDGAGLALTAELCAEYPGLSYELVPEWPLRIRGNSSKALRIGQDYLRYFEPPYEGGDRLRSRAGAFLPSRLESALASGLRRWPRSRRRLGSTARRLDRWLGDDPRVRRELERRRPSGLLVTPLVHFGSRQNSWVRAARGLGIPTMLCVHGWDNLTNKGLMHGLPDRVAVWNEAQRRQAIQMHGAEAQSVVITGAWPYDHWFGRRVSRSRAELCSQLGFGGERAIILYACSSRFIAERERAAVAEWLRALRSAPDPHLATANVIVRPHPLNADEWLDPSLEQASGVAIFPPGGADPVDDSSRADYFDSISHADAVVGVNTSALIESAILDRPAFAFPAPAFRSSQEELPHFRHLVGEHGMLKVSASMAEHVAQLSRTLADAEADAPARRRFVETFIRPLDGGPPPTERVVGTIEELLRASPEPRTYAAHPATGIGE